MTPERVAALNVAEVALLVTLISADTTVVEIAAKSLREIAIAERMPNGPINDLISPEIRVKRYTIYDQLGHPKINAVGKYLLIVCDLFPPNIDVIIQGELGNRNGFESCFGS